MKNIELVENTKFISDDFNNIVNRYPVDELLLSNLDKNILNETIVEKYLISFSKKQIPLYKESDDSEYFISIYENNHLNLMVLETNNKEFNINVKNHILYI